MARRTLLEEIQRGASYQGLTWTCHICGEERPDDRISVHKRDTSEEYGLAYGTVTENVRYCNDKPECEKGAQTYRHIKKEKGRKS